MITTSTIAFSFIGGIVPALLWLWFWLKEDPHPEPTRLIIHAFLAGMLMVILVIPFQNFIQNSFFPNDSDNFLFSFFQYPTFFTPFTKFLSNFLSAQIWIVILWAACEELFKFFAAYWTGLKQKEDDEPVDKIIYLVTAALGFAALENVLYIFSDLYDGNILSSFMIGNTRFIGTTLLHIICSASIGVFLGLSFYKSKLSKFIHLVLGFLVAISLHTAFNLFIMMSDESATITFTIFYFVWLSIIILLLCFEKVKNVIQINQT